MQVPWGGETKLKESKIANENNVKIKTIKRKFCTVYFRRRGKLVCVAEWWSLSARCVNYTPRGSSACLHQKRGPGIVRAFQCRMKRGFKKKERKIRNNNSEAASGCSIEKKEPLRWRLHYFSCFSDFFFSSLIKTLHCVCFAV